MAEKVFGNMGFATLPQAAGNRSGSWPLLAYGSGGALGGGEATELVST